MFLHSLEHSVPRVCLLLFTLNLLESLCRITPEGEAPLELILILCLVTTSTTLPLALICSALQELVDDQFCYSWDSYC